MIGRRVRERAVLPPGSGVFHAHGDIDEETERIARTPFDVVGGQALWDLWLITGGDRFRICLRAHHGFMDGVGLSHVAAALLPDSPGEGDRLPPAAKPTMRGLGRAFKDLAALLTHRSPWAPTPGPDAGARLGYRDVPMKALRAKADNYGVSVNDVNLAALGLAFSDWQRARVSEPARRDVVLCVAISTRTPQERFQLGNRLAVHRLRLSRSLTSWEEAISLVRRQTNRVRETRQRDALRLAMKVPGTLRPGVRLFRATLTAQATPFTVSSVSLPQHHTLFGAEMCAAGMTLNVFEGFPAYISFTRTPDNLRCAAVADSARRALLDVPEHWARRLA
ncbi:wax ester/triacylglycerol synthase domain-containing protein [Allokutzneria sp. NRRL B-24872]|uniref:wax ester/triacylglycerol synthase domain-containing protein n=1 Tax=Allokutzneria sp. NRRL B-24872 TaxID=1137961 RepID=UPI001177BBA4|nr:wax ester/triacylglycerol synthase domain-containing protein [Allokutzneria sp. NRRL B-24872]